jgi:hypothetical protein
MAYILADFESPLSNKGHFAGYGQSNAQGRPA